MLVFSEQDVIKDPPFSRVDLISCRNLLIYMNANLQRKVIALFHYALNPKGVLFLGTSETVTEQAALFMVLDSKWKLYLRRQDGVRPLRPELLMPMLTKVDDSGRSMPEPVDKHSEARDRVRNLTEKSLLAHYVQAAVLINRRGDIHYIVGRTGKYLEPAPGDATVNILSMAREGLRRELTTALHKAATRRRSSEPAWFARPHQWGLHHGQSDCAAGNRARGTGSRRTLSGHAGRGAGCLAGGRCGSQCRRRADRAER